MGFHYNNIPNHEGIYATANWLKYNNTKKDKASPLQELIKLILHNTNFMINEEHFLHKGDTSMRSMGMGSSFANLFLNIFETKA